MGKTLVAAAVAAIVSGGAFLASGANAMTLTAPSGLRAATEGAGAAEQVRYDCYRVRRHGVWVRKCNWRPNYRYRAQPYYGGYGYGYSPYYYRPYGYYGYGRPGVGLYYRF